MNPSNLHDQRPNAASSSSPAWGEGPVMRRLIPAIVFGLGLSYILWTAWPRSYDRIRPEGMDLGIDLQGFATLPILERGRVQPLDTLARVKLMIISGKQTWKDENDRRQPAIRWLMDVMVSPPTKDDKEFFKGPAVKHKIFRIDNDQVLDLLGLQPRSGLRYAFNEFSPRLEEFYKVAHAANKVESKKRDLYQRKVIELAQNLETFLELTSHKVPLSIPIDGEKWVSINEALQAGIKAIENYPPALAQLNMLTSYSSLVRDSSNARQAIMNFNENLDDYRHFLAEQMPGNMKLSNFEVFFNKFEPFYQPMVLYVWVFVLGCLSWVVLPRSLNRSAFWLAALALAVHTFALFARMYIQGRPPVTNLYSSAVFIGWGCVILGLILELLYRNGVGVVVAAITGGLTLIIAHYLSLGGDTMEMLQAVLDTNFWLATHVTIITLGYTATFVAGFMAILYVLFGVFTTLVTPEVNKWFGVRVYGVICFATFLSFLGTVLGGIWADQSWGRFWGWDPKENGALMIVIWTALILHARWAGMVKQRGVAVLAILGNIITAWSWFGVNMLGVGLHSYGFMSGALWWLLVFAGTQVIIAGIGLIPTQHWCSFAKPAIPREKEPSIIPGLVSR